MFMNQKIRTFSSLIKDFYSFFWKSVSYDAMDKILIEIQPINVSIETLINFRVLIQG